MRNLTDSPFEIILHKKSVIKFWRVVYLRHIMDMFVYSMFVAPDQKGTIVANYGAP